MCFIMKGILWDCQKNQLSILRVKDEFFEHLCRLLDLYNHVKSIRELFTVVQTLKCITEIHRLPDAIPLILIQWNQQTASDLVTV
jgi:hypothetical protein